MKGCVKSALCLGFSRMRNEGFSFISGGLEVESCSRLVVVAFATAVNRPQCCAMARTLGEAFGEGLGWKHDVSNSCSSEEMGGIVWKRNILKCGGSLFPLRRCSFVRSAVFFAVTLRFAFRGWCFLLLSRSCVFVTQLKIAILVDGSVLRTCRNHPKRVAWCKIC